MLLSWRSPAELETHRSQPTHSSAHMLKSRGRYGARKCSAGVGGGGRGAGSVGPKQEVGVASKKDLPGHTGQVMHVPT